MGSGSPAEGGGSSADGSGSCAAGGGSSAEGGGSPTDGGGSSAEGAGSPTDSGGRSTEGGKWPNEVRQRPDYRTFEFGGAAVRRADRRELAKINHCQPRVWRYTGRCGRRIIMAKRSSAPGSTSRRG